MFTLPFLQSLSLLLWFSLSVSVKVWWRLPPLMITFCDSHCQNIFNLVSPYTFLDAWRVWVQPVEVRRGVSHWGEAQGLWRLCPQLCQPVQPAGRRGESFKDCVFKKTRVSAISVKLWILNQLRWGSRTMGTRPTKMWLRGEDNFISVQYLHQHIAML